MSGTAMWSLSPTRSVWRGGSLTVENVAAAGGDAAFPDLQRDGCGFAERDPDGCECGLDAPDDRPGEQQRQVELLRHCAPLLAKAGPMRETFA